MNLSSSDSPENLAKSLQSWWALAGVDINYRDEPASLLEIGRHESAPEVQLVPTEKALGEKPGEQENQTFSNAPENYPDDYSDFIAWLGNTKNLAEAGWGRHFFAPEEITSPQIIVITAMPDVDADTGATLSRDAGQLLSRMLLASGYDPEKCLIMSMAMARSPAGQIDGSIAAQLKTRTQHLMKLCECESILVLGDSAARILFSEDLLNARGKKHFINHVSSKTEAVVTFHPRSLIQRPELKAQAWKDLQLILRKQNQ